MGHRKGNGERKQARGCCPLQRQCSLGVLFCDSVTGSTSLTVVLPLPSVLQVFSFHPTSLAMLSWSLGSHPGGLRVSAAGRGAVIL